MAGSNGSRPGASTKVLFPASLTPRQRALLHGVAEAEGLPHASEGTDANRRIAIGSVHLVDLDAAGCAPPMSDEALCQALQQHLGVDAAPHFQQDAERRASHTSASTLSTQPAPGVMRRVSAKPGAAAAGAVPSLDSFVALTRELIELEREAEVAQMTETTQMRSPEAAQARGTTLLNLRCEDIEGGLLGRQLLTLLSNKGYVGSGKGVVLPLLPPHKFTPHDVVALRPSKGAADGPPLVQGVVFRVRDTAIVVAVEDAPEEGLDQPLRLDKLANEVTYKRLKDTMNALSSTSSGSKDMPGSTLVDVMFGRREPRYVEPPPSWTPLNSSLDDSQRRAISMALAAKDVALVHGPPGTGKTTAVVEIIMQELARGSKVLACAASNIAVDNLVERLVTVGGGKTRVVRMGHPARLLPQVLDSSLEAHVLKSDNSSLAKDCRKEIKALNQKLMKLEHWKKAERRQIRDELRQLSKEEYKRQNAAVAEVLKGAQVVAATLTGVLHHSIEALSFDVVVIDEAAQALEAACWGALLKGRRAVLAGDHLQLPPTIISDTAAKRGLGRTLFERLQEMYGEAVSEMLTVQYRMNSAIMTWSSDELYQGKVTAHSSVAEHDLTGLAAALAAAPPAKPKAAGATGGKKAGAAAKGASAPAVAAAGAAGAAGEGGGKSLPVLLLIDTAGCGFEEKQEAEGDSRSNEGEAKAVMAHVDALIKAGIPADSIGIITPYNAQVALLKEMRPDRLAGVLEISSVDGFQGREKEAIVISMVRSNDKREVGFLSDRRRMNVAVTRARRHCALVCDSETVAADAFLGRLVKYFEAHGDYISAGELVPE